MSIQVIFQKIDKKSLLYLGIVVGAFLLVLGLIWHFSRDIEKKIIEEKPAPKEKTTEEVIQDLTVPEGGKIEQVSEEIQKHLIVPEKVKLKPAPKEIIKNLTVPE